MLEDLTVSLGDELTIDSKTNGGYTFNNHLNDPNTYTKLNSKPWDYVVLQGQSQEPSFPYTQVNSNTLPQAVRLADSVYANKYCSQAMYFMTWGRENGDPQWDSINSFYKMNDRLRSAYMRISDSAQASVAPVGSAWRYVRDNYPSIQLYSGDGSHPSVAGSYLAACTFYASLFHKSPVGASYLAGLDAPTAGILQNAAALSVLDSLEIFNLRTIEEIAIAGFTLVQEGATVNFTNSSWRSTEYAWNFGDGNSSVEMSPVHTFDNPGNYSVSLIASNECGDDTLTMSFEVLVNNLEEKEAMSLTQIAPSIYQLNGNHIVDVQLISSTGQNLKLENQKSSNSSSDFQVDLSGFPVGIYFLQIQSEFGFQRFKLLQ
jgi:PKD repeat protein